MDTNTPGIAAGRLSEADYARNFSDAHPPLNRTQALIEAERCYYCYDAPCITACPTGIDIPSFIQRIAQENNRGAAQAILEANPLGGMCARVCPTEMLCEQACVRNTNESKPVEIGLLQRFATDAFFSAKPDAKPLFTRAAATGKKVAVVGAGPAGLAAAHGLARRGHEVLLFESRPKLGGLNEYGLATYKTTEGFAQQEVDWLLSIGGITVKTGSHLGHDITLNQLAAEFDAVFLGLGLAGVNALGITEPQCEGVRPAVDFIAELRQSSPAEVRVGQKVLVIGGGMTAVDASVQSKKLGAREVTMVYRRGVEGLSASGYEQEWAQKNGVLLRTWAAPKQILAENGRVTGVQFAVTALRDGQLVETGEMFTIAADMVLKAIGQSFVPAGVELQLKSGRIATDANGKTSHAKVWAGGDCRFGGRDLTVEAVEHGKQAAISIDQFLSA
ncbi:NAD(P)-dependent oxidoreductase [Paucibacter sp. XJ19-41]|uniref:NAD(P)-dependent oxidoreductase n=1 Tax=Paucibacter sp. XJ19-41 TaxID=2927824 RepID=UPI0023496DD4|nr:NAD(P)-dependent oxidoreductase [Paucibacter sp. XJ19-41]MDC6169156.1 NAD(P)-dependent oxidoreductase [Paucibacter sp. XJ19-41]